MLRGSSEEASMKFAILSDIHGNIPALEAVWAEIRKNAVDRVYNLGDSLNGPLWPEETAEFIIGNNIESILGNGDQEILNEHAGTCYESNVGTAISSRTLEWLHSLEKTLVNNELTLFHATPYSTEEYLFEKILDNRVMIRGNEEIKNIIKGINTRYVACGHSHVERVMNIGWKIVINAGSVGLPAYTDHDPFHCMETFNPYAKFVIVDNGTVRINMVEYDHMKAAERARQNGRADWHNWLSTGRCN